MSLFHLRTLLETAKISTLEIFQPYTMYIINFCVFILLPDVVDISLDYIIYFCCDIKAPLCQYMPYWHGSQILLAQFMLNMAQVEVHEAI